MRLIVFILIGYILGLSFVPCSDTGNHCEETVMETQLNQPHNHANDSTDSCSIFCYCNCCSGNITVFAYQLPQVAAIPISIYFNNHIPVLNSPVISTYVGNIWQPPKVNA